MELNNTEDFPLLFEESNSSRFAVNSNMMKPGNNLIAEHENVNVDSTLPKTYDPVQFIDYQTTSFPNDNTCIEGIAVDNTKCDLSYGMQSDSPATGMQSESPATEDLGSGMQDNFPDTEGLRSGIQNNSPATEEFSFVMQNDSPAAEDLGSGMQNDSPATEDGKTGGEHLTVLRINNGEGNVATVVRQKEQSNVAKTEKYSGDNVVNPCIECTAGPINSATESAKAISNSILSNSRPPSAPSDQLRGRNVNLSGPSTPKQSSTGSATYSRTSTRTYNSMQRPGMSGTLYLIPLEHEPRIYVAAPSGVQVTRIKAVDIRDPDIPVRYSMYSSNNDSQFFQIHGESGNITTRRYIERKAGDYYNLTIEARSRSGVISRDIKIFVTEYNRFSPVFEKVNYTVDLDVLTPVPSDFLTVRAIDKDPLPYNSEVYYSLLTIHDMVSVNRTTGVLSLNKKLPAFYKHLFFTIVARDGGSPPRTSKTKLTIVIKILSAPKQVAVVETGDKWAMLCWESPLSGNALGYLILLYNNATTDIRNYTTSALGVKNGMWCKAVPSLTKWTNYTVQVAGWNHEEVGMKSRPLPLSTQVNRTCYNTNITDYRCTCLPGHYGPNCSLFNPCNASETPCKNGGACFSNTSNTYTCSCLEGYYGSSCEHFNPCSRNPCQHNSPCFNITSSKYECQCTPGYTGNMCEVDIDDCYPYPCHHNATCIDGLNEYKCVCGSGFEGELCQYNIDECKKDPCQNGATCVDEVGSYVCLCVPGFDGDNCENNIDDCQSNPCENNATCTDRVNDYYCDCQAGFEGDYCEDEINECMSRPCLNGGSCTDAFNDFSCVCPPGYNGKRCEWDVDLCQSQPCQNGGICVDLVDHFDCKCEKGYEGTYCELKVQCPAEMVQTDRGTFLWKPVEHGIISRLPCPYGIDTNYTDLQSKMTRSQRNSPPVDSDHTGFAHLDGGSISKRAEGALEDVRTRRFSLNYKKDPVKLHAHNKDLEYKRSQEIIEVDQERMMKENQLQIDEEGVPYAVRSCLQLKDGSVRWGNMVDKICRDKNSTYMEKWSQELEQLTKDPAQISSEVFINASLQIRQILDYALVDKKIAQSMFAVISNIMVVNETVLEEADKNGIVTKGLVQVIDTYVNSVKLSNTKKLAISSENIALETREIFTSNQASSDSLTYSPPKVTFKEPALLLEDGFENKETLQGIYITIPREAVDKALKQTHSLRIQFVSYKNSNFFRANNINSTTSSSLNTKHRVISASLSNMSVSNLTESLVYVFQNPYGSAKQKCVYWEPESQEWSDEGITTNQTMDWIQCESSHMTAFSVLLDSHLGLPIPDRHKKILSVLSYAGSIMSVIGLFATVVTYIMFRCLNRDRSGKILINLSVSLLFMNIAYLLVAAKENMGSRWLMVTDLCTGIALCTHYLVLTSLSWMLVEALNMYQLLITVFATSESKFMCKRMICAWGIPLLIVGGVAWYDIDFYISTADSQYCIVMWSKTVLYFVAYVGPTTLILFINVIVFTLVCKVLCQRRVHAIGKIGSENPILTCAQVRGAISVMALLGVTWMFGIFAWGEFRLVFQYLFCISNSLQGFIIFLVRCIGYPEARKAWMTFLHTGKLKKHRGPHGGQGLPSSSVVNSHSRHTISSSTQSNTQPHGLGGSHYRSHSQSQLQSRHRSSHSYSTRKTSLPESSSTVNTSSSSLWNRFRQREAAYNTHDNTCPKSTFCSFFRPSAGFKTNTAPLPEKERPQHNDDDYRPAPIEDKLRQELVAAMEKRNAEFLMARALSMDVYSISSKPETNVQRGTSSLKRGGSMRCQSSQQPQPQPQEKQQSNSQQSLVMKEGEESSWQFMETSGAGITEAKATTADSRTTNHSHSDQGYMSGACTAEHSPESPHIQPKESFLNTLQTSEMPVIVHQNNRLTSSTPDHLYPYPCEAVKGENKNLLTKSENDLTVLLPKPQVERLLWPNVYITQRRRLNYVSPPALCPTLVYKEKAPLTKQIHERKLLQTGRQRFSTGGTITIDSDAFYGGISRVTSQVHYHLDHLPQPLPCSNSRRSSSTKSFTSSDGNNGGSSSTGSLDYDDLSFELQPRIIHVSTARRPVHRVRHHLKSICSEEVV